MPSANSNQIISASADNDLRERIIALAAQEPSIANPHAWVAERLPKLVGAELPGVGTEPPTSIAKVYEYAAVNYQPAPTPGANPAAVTDDHIRAAIRRIMPPTAV